MKNLLIALCCMFATTAASGQHQAITQFVGKYSDGKDVQHFSIGGNLLNFMTERTDEQGTRKLRTQLRQLTLISIPDPAAVAADDLHALRQSLYANDYEELIKVRDGKELVHIFLLENKQKVIEQLVLLVESEESVTLITLSGELYFDDIRHLHIDGPAGDSLQEHWPAEKRP